MSDITTIVFSKNRIFQLKECLRTLRKFIPTAETVVLAKYDDETIYRADLPKAKIQQERRGHFYNQLLAILSNVQTPLVMFAPDDLIFIRPVPVARIGECLWATKGKAYGFHCRLHPGISICQSAFDKLEKRPRFLPTWEYWLFDWQEGTWDWNYPFEVDGAIYRTSDILRLFLECHNAHNPNLLESECWHLIRDKKIKWPQWGMCGNDPLCVNLPINMVGDNAQSPTVDVGYTREELNSHLDWEIDEGYFVRHPEIMVSPHVGILPLKGIPSCQTAH